MSAILFPAFKKGRSAYGPVPEMISALRPHTGRRCRRLPFLKAVIILGKVSSLLRQKQTLRLLNKALWRLRQVMEVFAEGPPQLPLTKSYLQACTFGSAAHWAN